MRQIVQKVQTEIKQSRDARGKLQKRTQIENSTKTQAKSLGAIDFN